MGIKWLVKAAAQGAISLLPQRNAINYVFQRHVTKSLVLNYSRVQRRLQWCADHLTFYKTYRGGLPQHTLELGTGWVPTVPLALALCGVPRVTTIDIHDLKKTFILDKLLAIIYDTPFETLCEALPFIERQRFDALLQLRGAPPPEVFAALGITFLIADAQQTDFPDASVDFLISNTTLEHIPPAIIAGIWKEFRRIATPNALMSHLIDMGDHYSHFDSSITPYHFLQHEPWAWALVNNRLMYQNRLRAPDYKDIHEAAGFRLLHERPNVRSAPKLNGIRLARAFQHYSRNDLIPTSSWMVSEPI